MLLGASVLVCALALSTVALRPAAADQAALLRPVHLSPDTPAVDVAVTTLPGGDLVGSTAHLAYGGVAPFQRLAPGRYAVSIRAAGAAPATPPLLTVAVELGAGTAHTVELGGRFARLRLDVLTDDLQPPPPGQTRLRALIATGSAAAVGLSLPDGPRLPDGAHSPAGSGWASVPAATPAARLTWSGGADDVPLHLPAGAVVTLLVVDGPDGRPTIRTVVDAAGPAVVPVGPVDAGLGGAAGWAPPVPGTALPLRLLGGAGLVAPTPRPAPAPAVPAVTGPLPVQLIAPDADIDAPLVPVAPDAAGMLAAPQDPGVAGWLRAGPAPGEPGPAVLAGHVDSTRGPAVFFRLARLTSGGRVLVRRADGAVIAFVVDRVERYAKDAFPTAEVYGPTPDPELRLITCGGRFDPQAGSYADDVVVYARLAG